MKSAVVCIIKKGKNVLFCKRAPAKGHFPNMWALPAGGMEGDETPFQTAQREMMEELGVQIKIAKILNCHYEESENYMQIFLLCSTEDEPRIADGENSELKWLPFSDFLKAHKDEEIPPGLRYLRKNPQIWKGL
ncbi:hypothetical protein A3K63_02650 [Candidatus Micrarchaeota archaeon RBG_16_49_10]|nr:MAG: hypothetical protein A3K63_02650 [Candidatus Micrarchaeota archaeon RBG_16_49_10]